MKIEVRAGNELSDHEKRCEPSISYADSANAPQAPLDALKRDIAGKLRNGCRVVLVKKAPDFFAVALGCGLAKSLHLLMADSHDGLLCRC